jgi:hypothetical protein
LVRLVDKTDMCQVVPACVKRDDFELRRAVRLQTKQKDTNKIGELFHWIKVAPLQQKPIAMAMECAEWQTPILGGAGGSTITLGRRIGVVTNVRAAGEASKRIKRSQRSHPG